MKLEAMEESKAAKSSGLNPELVAFINRACTDAAASAAMQQGKMTESMLLEAVSKVEERLASIEAPPRMIARIELGEIKTDLGADEEISEQTAEVIAEIVRNTKLGLNTMLVGPAGCGKTTMAAMAAKIMGVPFGLISWTAGMSETPALFARWDGTKYIEAQWSAMYSEPGIFCHDEMDRADANALCKINAGTANGHFYNEVLCVTKNRHPMFGVVATCNTVGRGGDSVYNGANALDGSTLTRFEKFAVDYDASYEKRVCPDKGIYKLLTSARAKLKELQAQEIISTRELRGTYLKHQAGKPLQACIDSVTMGWNPDLIRQVGLDAKSVEKLVDAKEDAKETLTNDSGSTSAKAVGGQAQEKSGDTVKAKIAANEDKMAELKRKLDEMARRS